MIAMGIGHAIIGVTLFHDTLVDMLREGLVGTVQPPGYRAEPDYDRIALFWLLIFSPVLSMLGQITSRAIARGDVGILKVVGWNLLAVGLAGTAVLPISGNPVLIVLGVLILAAASQVRAGKDPRRD